MAQEAGFAKGVHSHDEVARMLARHFAASAAPAATADPYTCAACNP